MLTALITLSHRSSLHNIEAIALKTEEFECVEHFSPFVGAGIHHHLVIGFADVAIRKIPLGIIMSIERVPWTSTRSNQQIKIL